MALSLDDRILGEKTHYYCSSSEDEDDDDNSEHKGEGKESTKGEKLPTFIPEPDVNQYSGSCTNTGPKGVINDWRRFKQLETEKREDQEREKLGLAKKLSITCRTNAEDEKEREKDAAFMQQLEEEFDEFEEEFLKEYRQKRLEEIRKAVETTPKFGKVKELTKEEFVEAIDSECAMVTVVIHVYEKGVVACEAMNRCLECLAQEYPHVKFCRIRASTTHLSINFAISGVPALLIYRKGELIGNFVHLSDEFGDEFYSTDVESFLIEHGMLPDTAILQKTIRTENGEPSDSDSDFGVD